MCKFEYGYPLVWQGLVWLNHEFLYLLKFILVKKLDLNAKPFYLNAEF